MPFPRTFAGLVTAFTSYLDDNFNAILASSGAALVGFLQFGAGASARDSQSKQRESVSLADFGALPNDSSAGTKAINSAALAAAMASFPEQATAPLDGTSYSSAGRLNFGPGTWWFNARLNVVRNVHFLGASAPDGNCFGATRLVFPDGDSGIVLYNAPGAVIAGLGTRGGDGSVFEKLSIIPAAYATSGATPAAGSNHGIWLRARARIRDCQVSGWSGNGINIVASSGGGGTLEGNANNWQVDSVRLQQNGTDGFFVSNSDVNAGLGTRIESSNNRGWGINDQSFLGNAYVGCHAAANTTGAYQSTNINARNIFTGCHSESGQPASNILPPAMFVGGLQAAGFTAGSVGTILGDRGLLVVTSAGASAGIPSIALGSDPTSGLYAIGTALGRYGWSSLGAQTAQFGPGGIKTSTNNIFWSATQAATEFVQGSTTLHTSVDYATSAAYTGTGKRIQVDTAAGTGFNLLTCTNLVGGGFLVLGNGNCQNTNNSYGAISDIKLKENIAPAASAWAKAKALNWVTYNLKADPGAGRMLGLIAQEAETVAPGLVYETPDYEEVVSEIDGERHVERTAMGTVTKGVKYSVANMLGMVALQEAQRRIEALEAQVAALIARVGA